MRYHFIFRNASICLANQKWAMIVEMKSSMRMCHSPNETLVAEEFNSTFQIKYF